MCWWPVTAISPVFLRSLGLPISLFVHNTRMTSLTLLLYTQKQTMWVTWIYFFNSFLAFDFCRFCVVIRFLHPRHNGQWPPTSKDVHTRFYPLHFYPILNLEKEPVFPFLMSSAKQGNYWYHFYNVFGMTRSLTGDWTRDLPHSKPAQYH